MYKRLLLFRLSAALCLLLLFCQQTMLQGCKNSSTKTIVLLVPGYNCPAQYFEEQGLISQLEAKGFKNGGNVRVPVSMLNMEANLYSMHFSDSIGSVENLSYEVEKAVEAISSAHNHNVKFVLVGYSMGSLASRLAMVRNFNSTDKPKWTIEAFMSIGGPNNGSFWANALSAADLLGIPLAESLGVIIGRPLTGRAMHDLTQSNMSLTADLNKKPHPPIRYHSFVGQLVTESDLSSWASSLSGSSLFSQFSGMLSTYTGDGIVSMDSQHLGKIPSIQLAAKGIKADTLSGVHTHLIKNHNAKIASTISGYVN